MFSANWLGCGWCHPKRLPSLCMFCAHITAMLQFSVIQSHLCSSRQKGHAAFFFCISVIHPTLTWTAGPLTHVCDLFACTYTQGDIRWSFGWVASLVVFVLQCASGLGLSFQFCGLQILYIRVSLLSYLEFHFEV